MQKRGEEGEHDVITCHNLGIHYRTPHLDTYTNSKTEMTPANSFLNIFQNIISALNEYTHYK